jgi:hypothetical protein
MARAFTPDNLFEADEETQAKMLVAILEIFDNTGRSLALAIVKEIGAGGPQRYGEGFSWLTDIAEGMDVS